MTDPLRHILTGLILLTLAACVSGPAEQLPAPLRQAQNLLGEGVEHYRNGQYPAAQRLFARALEHYRLLDNPQGIVASSINMARVLHASGDTARARQWLQQAGALNRQYQPPNRQQLAAHIRLLQAGIAAEQNRLDDAITALDTLLAGDVDTAVRLGALQLRTRVAGLQQQDFRRWLQAYADAVKAGGNAPGPAARLARFQAQAAAERNEKNALFSRALTLYRQQANRPGIAATLTEWAQQDMVAGEAETAEDKLLRALHIRLALHDSTRARQVLTGLQALYRQNRQEARLQQANDWLDRLSATGFDNWQDAMQAFDTYPQ